MAAVKGRKDSRGYVLRNGETQRKDGRYCFAYTDRRKKRHYIYAQTLTDLREKEKSLQLKYDQGLDAHSSGKLTVNDLYDKYISLKFDLKQTTKANYLYMYNHFVRHSFGKRKLAEVRYSDVKEFYNSILQGGMLANTLENIHTQVHPAFRMAVQDGLILCNPASDVMREIKRSNLWVKPKRHALTIPQQKAFLNFLENNRDYEGWIPIITVLLGTGMRIGECLGLRWKDLDFKEETISVNHNLSYGPDENGECKKHIQTTKTKAGNRVIPMSKDVYEAFLTEYEIQKCLGFCEEEIDGYSGFVFSTATHTVYGASAVNNAIHRATAEYNKQEEIFAREENREPLRLPDFSAHNLRHTYCTRLCENEKNIKVIEYLMGHSDISTTMDIYAEVNQEKLKDVMTNLEGCIIIK